MGRRRKRSRERGWKVMKWKQTEEENDEEKEQNEGYEEGDDATPERAA